MGQITVTKTPIEGLYIIEPAVHGDERGYFVETYNQRDMAEAGFNQVFVQDNQSMSRRAFCADFTIRRSILRQSS